jgi:hypothetical protein
MSRVNQISKKNQGLQKIRMCQKERLEAEGNMSAWRIKPK